VEAQLRYPSRGGRYAQQEELMVALSSCLEAGGVGIFESPTGTGKSLSLLCASLSWLHAQEAKDEEEAKHDDSADEPAWLVEQAAAAATAARRAGRPSIIEGRRLRELRLSSSLAAAAAASDAAAAASDAADGTPTALAGARVRSVKPGRGGGAPTAACGDEDLAALAAAAAGAEECVAGDEFALTEVTEEGVSLEQELALAALDDDDDDAPERPPKRQLFFCSRTHSQLSQLVRTRTARSHHAHCTLRARRALRARCIPMHPLRPPQVGEVQKTEYARSIGLVSLAGRNNLCVHEPVRARSGELINDACLDLQQVCAPEALRLFCPLPPFRPPLHSATP